MSVRLNASDTVLGRTASYVWGPDVGSSWFARADWQRAGGVGGLLMILDGVSTPRSDGSNTPADLESRRFKMEDDRRAFA